MVKLIGPAFSNDARGTLADLLSFAKTGNTNYVKLRTVPTDRKTPPQISVRAMMTWLSQQWAAISTANKATWTPATEHAALSNFNAYTRANQRAHRKSQTVYQMHPPTYTPPADPIVWFARVGRPRHVYIIMREDTIHNDNWGIAIHRSLSSGFTPAFHNFVAAAPSGRGANVHFYDIPLAPATYYYRLRGFSTHGRASFLSPEFDATVP